MAKAQYKILGGKTYKTGIPAVIPGKTATLPTAPAAKVDPYADLWKIVNTGLQSPAQVAATANAQALAGEKARLAAMKAISDQTVSQYNNQATRAEGFAAALARNQGNEDQEAFARYGQAADRLAGLGAGLTGAVGAGYQSGVDRTREAIAELTGGLGNVTATPGADIANVAQYSGATMPANTLQSNAAAAARLAQSDAAARAQNIHFIGQGYTTKADDAIAQYGSDARAEIAKRPANIAELVNSLNAARQTGISNIANVLNARTAYGQTEQKRLDDLKQQRFENHATAVANKLALDKFKSDNAHWVAENARADRQVDITEAALDNTMRQTGASILGVDPKTGMPTLSSVTANRQWQAQLAQIAQNQSAQNGYRMVWQGGKLVPQTDAKGNLKPLGGYTLTKDGQGVKKTYASSATGGAGRGGLTPSGWSSLVKSTQKQVIAGTSTKGGGYLYAPDDENAGKNGAPAGFIPDPNKPPKGAVSYQDALKSAVEAGPNTTRWAAKAKSLVDAQYDPGENGRAYQTIKQAQPEIQREVAASLAKGESARDNYLALVGSGVYPPKLRKQAIYAINKLYSQAYFKQNPGAKQLPIEWTVGAV